MPPKAKFTKEEVIDKAFEIVRENGFDILTARYLGERLGSSARPIFTLFKSMDEVCDGVISRANALYCEYIERGLASQIPFKGVGEQYILFAINEAKLFQLLFMSRCDGADSNTLLSLIDTNYQNIMIAIKNSYDISEENAFRLYKHLFIYTHGIATLCATNTCLFSADEISSMLTDVFVGILKRIKDEK